MLRQREAEVFDVLEKHFDDGGSFVLRFTPVVGTERLEELKLDLHGVAGRRFFALVKELLDAEPVFHDLRGVRIHEWAES